MRGKEKRVREQGHERKREESEEAGRWERRGVLK